MAGEVVEDKVDDSAAIVDALKAQAEVLQSLKDAIAEVTAFRIGDAVEKETEVDELDYHIGYPTDRQLTSINSLLGYESNAEDWLVCSFHASNVLLDHEMRSWDESSLYQMGMSAIGRPLLLNHQWGDVSSVRGFIFDAKLVKDSEVDEEMLKGAGREEYNKEIIEQNDGMLWLYLSACVSRNSETADAILSRRVSDCSTGSILHDPYMICPDCTKEHRKATGTKESVGFMDYEVDEKGRKQYRCPHLIPSRWLLGYLGEEASEYNFARWAILAARDSTFVEHTACVQACLPQARVLREKP